MLIWYSELLLAVPVKLACQLCLNHVIWVSVVQRTVNKKNPGARHKSYSWRVARRTAENLDGSPGSENCSSNQHVDKAVTSNGALTL